MSMINSIIGLAWFAVQQQGAMLALTPKLVQPTAWLPLAVIVALVVLAVAALIYVMAPILNSYRMREWALFQIYEAGLSLALIFVFLGIVGILAINPVPILTSINIVPQGCQASNGVNSIYSLAACDLAQFNNAGYALADYVYIFSFIGATVPGLNINVRPFPSESGIVLTLALPPFTGTIDSTTLNWVFAGLADALLIGELQLILIASSVFLFYFLMTVGLISRVFGFARSFGGAMIALGIGIGILFPLITAVTYGFVDVSSNAYCVASLSCTAATAATGVKSGVTLSAQACTNALPGVLGTTVTAAAPIVGCLVALLTTPSTTYTSAFGAALAYIFQEVGYILAGFTIIPIMNIIIIDIFIMDFSKAVGEQMSFSQLFSGFV